MTGHWTLEGPQVGAAGFSVLVEFNVTKASGLAKETAFTYDLDAFSPLVTITLDWQDISMIVKNDTPNRAKFWMMVEVVATN